MKQLNRTTANIEPRFPEKILQFGGGNFLRAFADWIIDIYNEKKNTDIGILVVSSSGRNNYDILQQQEGLYHVFSRGYQNGQIVDEKRLVKSISRVLDSINNWDEFLQSAENPDLRFIISNTTEAGIRFSSSDKMQDRPPKEFPAKLTLWLFRRYKYFNGDLKTGCIFLPVELILDNGATLKKCILQYIESWGLEEEFKYWIEDANIFCNSLVDRIVPGINPEMRSQENKKIGFNDEMMTEGEVFHFWAIEGPSIVREELPLDESGLNVIFTDDLSSFRTRKVRILNGAHTSMVPVGYLYGLETVREAVEHEVMGKYIQQAIFQEIIPSLNGSHDNLQQFAHDVIDRFKNPFIKHQLISIALNSISKFKTRVLPSIIEYQRRFEKLPKSLVFSMAALIQFYRGEHQEQNIPLKDDQIVIDYLKGLWRDYDGSNESLGDLVERVLKWEYAWKMDLSEIPGLSLMVRDYLIKIEDQGIQEILNELVI